MRAGSWRSARKKKRRDGSSMRRGRIAIGGLCIWRAGKGFTALQALQHCLTRGSSRDLQRLLSSSVLAIHCRIQKCCRGTMPLSQRVSRAVPEPARASSLLQSAVCTGLHPAGACWSAGDWRGPRSEIGTALCLADLKGVRTPSFGVCDCSHAHCPPPALFHCTLCSHTRGDMLILRRPQLSSLGEARLDSGFALRDFASELRRSSGVQTRPQATHRQRSGSQVFIVAKRLTPLECARGLQQETGERETEKGRIQKAASASSLHLSSSLQRIKTFIIPIPLHSGAQRRTLRAFEASGLPCRTLSDQARSHFPSKSMS